MKQQKTCFFIGHRDAPEDLFPRLRDAVARHITEFGVTDFVVGHYGSFDRMSARAVREEKKLYPEVTLTLLLPYYPYEYDAAEYDGSFYPPGMETVPKPFAISRANQYMIRHCDFLICYNCGQIGKTREFVELAMRRQSEGKLLITNLADHGIS